MSGFLGPLSSALSLWAWVLFRLGGLPFPRVLHEVSRSNGLNSEHPEQGGRHRCLSCCLLPYSHVTSGINDFSQKAQLPHL